jgi:hypothetical protein
MTTESDEQAERRETMLQDADLRRRQEREEQARGATYLDHYQSDVGGRFVVTERETITGLPSPQPPPLPANSPWAGEDLVGIEPPLGVAIDRMPELEQPTETCAVGTGGAVDEPSGWAPLTDVERAAPPSSDSEEWGDAAA